LGQEENNNPLRFFGEKPPASFDAVFAATFYAYFWAKGLSRRAADPRPDIHLLQRAFSSVFS